MRECSRWRENVRNAVGGEHEECNGREGGRKNYHKAHSRPSPHFPAAYAAGTGA